MAYILVAVVMTLSVRSLSP